MGNVTSPLIPHSASERTENREFTGSTPDILEDYPYLTDEDIKASLHYAAAQADHAVVIAS